MANISIFNRLMAVVETLRSTTIISERRNWFVGLYLEFKVLERTLRHSDIPEWQKKALNHATEDFNEAKNFFSGKAITNPSLHYN